MKIPTATSQPVASRFARSLKHQLPGQVFSRLPGSWLKRLSRVKPVIAYYHIVADTEVPHVKQLYPVRSVVDFESDLDTFLEFYQPITLQTLIESLNNGSPLPDNSFLLTFDDGFRENAEVIAPILLKKGVPAAFFVTTGFLDNRGMAHHNKISLLLERMAQLGSASPRQEIREALQGYGIDCSDLRTALLSIECRNREAVDRIAALLKYDFQTYLSSARPYLSCEEVRSLIDRGFAIGAHSIDHPRYADISADDQLHQTKASVRFLSEQFSLRYRAFAFPHGDRNISDRLLEQLHEAGDIDVSFGTGGILADDRPRHFQRFSMEYESSPARRVLAGQYIRGLYRTWCRSRPTKNSMSS
jgi:peptidoglycan/xylan/chitin deacetylase (PgdA/CDA1 family)